MKECSNKKKGIIPIQSFLLIFKNDFIQEQAISSADNFIKLGAYNHLNWDDKGIEILFFTRELVKTSYSLSDNLKFIVGDDFELENSNCKESMSNAVFIEIDKKRGLCKLFASIIGLPPIFCYQDDKRIILTSDIILLTKIKGFHLEFNIQSLIDLCIIGHPVKHNTLFKNVNMIKGGNYIEWISGKSFTIKNIWNTANNNITLKDWNNFCDEQINAFLYSMEKLSIENSFLSLTSGLDTRTILAVLVNQGRSIEESYTMSGYPFTLDARAAIDLANHYGIKHNTIILDNNFINNIENHVIEASRLSGGIYSLEQASEIFFYEQINRNLTGRISGNMGNQIGRGGTEGISLRNGNLEILNPELQEFADKNTEDHWLKQMNINSKGLDFITLLQDEIPNSLVGNYCIGNYYVVQKSPYSHRKLINISRLMPQKNKNNNISLIKIRIGDLYHRFFGKSEKVSFQRKLINRYGGYAAHYPINWGWRASGGISIGRALQGCFSIIDTIAEKKRIYNPTIQKLFEIFGISGLHVYKHTNYWMKIRLKDFIYDNVFSETSNKLFENRIMNKVLEEYFYKDNFTYYNTICFALDVCLANKLFIK
jgi:hypothetical protein